MAIKTLDDLLRAVQDRPRKRLAVAWANDAHTLEGVNAAVETGLVEAILVGDEPTMRQVCQELALPPERFRFIHAATDSEAAAKAVGLIRSGEADLLMKGHEFLPFLIGQVGQTGGRKTMGGLENHGGIRAGGGTRRRLLTRRLGGRHHLHKDRLHGGIDLHHGVVHRFLGRFHRLPGILHPLFEFRIQLDGLVMRRFDLGLFGFRQPTHRPPLFHGRGRGNGSRLGR